MDPSDSNILLPRYGHGDRDLHRSLVGFELRWELHLQARKWMRCDELLTLVDIDKLFSGARHLVDMSPASRAMVTVQALFSERMD
jgi:hypothetical protein